MIKKITLFSVILAIMVFFLPNMILAVYASTPSSLARKTTFTIPGGQWLSNPIPYAHFAFMDDKGRPFTEINLQGHWTLLFYGYARCQHVCPTTLHMLQSAYNTWSKTLPPNQRPQIVMVSIDSDRDTVSDMHQFVSAYNPNFIGIRADRDETERLQKQMNVYATKIPMNNGNPQDYMVKHTPELFIISPDGKIRGYFNYPEAVDDVVLGYEKIVKAHFVS